MYYHGLKKKTDSHISSCQLIPQDGEESCQFTSTHIVHIFDAIRKKVLDCQA